jgi:cytochrome c biogenesis protein CcmG, thiol:disulfide interchange protein DsbE
MKKSRLIVIVLLFAFGASLLYASVVLYKSTGVATVGQKAPDFSRPDLAGKTFSLSQMKGQFIVLNFFTTWCPPCREEAPELQKFQEEYGNRVRFFYVNRGEPELLVKQFIREFKITSTVLMDKNDQLSAEYGVTGQPETFFIDENGMIREHVVGPMRKEELENRVKKYSSHLLEK